MTPRETRTVALTLVGAVLLYSSIASLGTPIFWGCFLALGLLAAGVLVSRRGANRGPRSGGFLCDTCKYDDHRYCNRPERPNATTCPDYKRRS